MVDAAARDWGRQIFVATHSPVMISQFESHELLVAEKAEGGMNVRRLDEITGEGEARFLPELFKMFHRLPSRPQCTFELIRRIGQRSQRSVRNRLLMAGTGKLLPDRDMDEIGLPARFYLQKHGEHAHVLLIDDLEWDRRARRCSSW